MHEHYRGRCSHCDQEERIGLLAGVAVGLVSAIILAGLAFGMLLLKGAGG